jgi:SAM-dependent methyltransferase
MHPAAYHYVAGQSSLIVTPEMSVVEIGGRNVNGSVRSLFPTQRYSAIDVVDGPGVDIVADGADWRPSEPVDCVVCCEVLEHTQKVKAIVNNAAKMLRSGGRFIVTCAGRNRPPCSPIDGGAPRPGEFYQNIELDLILRILGEPDRTTGQLRWRRFEFSFERSGQDLFFYAIRS